MFHCWRKIRASIQKVGTISKRSNGSDESLSVGKKKNTFHRVCRSIPLRFSLHFSAGAIAIARKTLMRFMFGILDEAFGASDFNNQHGLGRHRSEKTTERATPWKMCCFELQLIDLISQKVINEWFQWIEDTNARDKSLSLSYRECLRLIFLRMLKLDFHQFRVHFMTFYVQLSISQSNMAKVEISLNFSMLRATDDTLCIFSSSMSIEVHLSSIKIR